MSTNGEPIKGLYAVGEVTGGIHAGNRLGAMLSAKHSRSDVTPAQMLHLKNHKDSKKIMRNIQEAA